MNLPKQVIQEDRKLDETKEGAAEKLMKLRWHWTKDEDNPNRVSMAEYARQVGLTAKTIEIDVKAYDTIRTSAVTKSDPRGKMSASDARERAKMTVETASVTEAVAKARGIGIGTARQHHKDTVKKVRNLARDRAETQGTSVGDEAPRIAEEIVTAEKAEKKEQKKRSNAGMDTAEIEVLLRKARSNLADALVIAKNAKFNDAEIESLEDDMSKVRAELGRIEVMISGNTAVDWDSELAKIG